jgi:hypothetical protein
MLSHALPAYPGVVVYPLCRTLKGQYSLFDFFMVVYYPMSGVSSKGWTLQLVIIFSILVATTQIKKGKDVWALGPCQSPILIMVCLQTNLLRVQHAILLTLYPFKPRNFHDLWDQR